jgi:hypothetical protein
MSRVMLVAIASVLMASASLRVGAQGSQGMCRQVDSWRYARALPVIWWRKIKTFLRW